MRARSRFTLLTHVNTAILDVARNILDDDVPPEENIVQFINKKEE